MEAQGTLQLCSQADEELSPEELSRKRLTAIQRSLAVYLRAEILHSAGAYNAARLELYEAVRTLGLPASEGLSFDLRRVIDITQTMTDRLRSQRDAAAVKGPRHPGPPRRGVWGRDQNTVRREFYEAMSGALAFESGSDDSVKLREAVFPLVAVPGRAFAVA